MVLNIFIYHRYMWSALMIHLRWTKKYPQGLLETLCGEVNISCLLRASLIEHKGHMFLSGYTSRLHLRLKYNNVVLMCVRQLDNYQHYNYMTFLILHMIIYYDYPYVAGCSTVSHIHVGPACIILHLSCLHFR